MLKSKVKYGDQKAHAVTAAFQLLKHDHARTVLTYIYTHIYIYIIIPASTPNNGEGSLGDHWGITGGSLGDHEESVTLRVAMLTWPLGDHWGITGGSLRDHWGITKNR